MQQMRLVSDRKCTARHLYSAMWDTIGKLILMPTDVFDTKRYHGVKTVKTGIYKEPLIITITNLDWR